MFIIPIRSEFSPETYVGNNGCNSLPERVCYDRMLTVLPLVEARNCLRRKQKPGSLSRAYFFSPYPAFLTVL